MSTQQKLDNLKKTLERNFVPAENVKTVHVPLRGAAGYLQYLQDWEVIARSLIEDTVESLVDQREWWTNDACGLGVDGDVAEEILHHSLLARQKCATFVGRETLVRDAVRIIRARSQIPRIGGIKSQRLLYSGIWLSIVGKSGVGKTSFIAKLAHMLREEEKLVPVWRSSAAAVSKSSGKGAGVGPDGSVRPVIVRFCGTSRASMDGLSLVRSLCQQLDLIFPSKEPPVISYNYEEAVALLHHYLRNHAVILLIDGLDLLSDAHLARSKVSFLAGIQPHPSTRIVVSSLPDDGRPPLRMSKNASLRGRVVQTLKHNVVGRLMLGCVANSTAASGSKQSSVAPTSMRRETARRLSLGRGGGGGGGGGSSVQNSQFSETSSPFKKHHVFNCETCLIAAAVPRFSISNFQKGLTTPDAAVTTAASAVAPALSTPAVRRASWLMGMSRSKAKTDEAKVLLEESLGRAGRTLTPAQWTLVMGRIAAEPTALYISLALHVVSQWTSFAAHVELRGTVEGVVEQLFDKIERDHGIVFARAALGYLTLCVQGVSDSEMVDLLSLDDEVLASVQPSCSLGIRRVPRSLWLCLRGDLGPLITESCTGHLQWAHRRIQESAEQRFSEDSAEKARRHALLGCYFANIVPPDLVAARGITCQPVVSSFVVEEEDEDEEADADDAAVKSALARSEKAASEVGSAAGKSVASVAGRSVPSVRRATATDKKSARREVQSGVGPPRSIASVSVPGTSHHLNSGNSRVGGGSTVAGGGSTIRTLAPDVVTSSSVELNWRRAVEASHHLLEAGQLVEAQVELCSLDSIASRLRLGLMYDAVEQLGRLVSALRDRLAVRPDAGEQAALYRAEMYHRWLMMDAAKLVAKPHLLTSSCTSQPLTSVPRRDMEAMLKESAAGFVTSATEYTWIRARCLGGKSVYEMLLSTFEGHESFVTTVAWSPDGSRIASGSNDGTVRIWNPATGSAVSILKCNFAQVFAVEFCPRGQQLAVAGADKNTVCVFDLGTDTLTALLIGHSQAVLAMSWSPCSTQIMTGSADNTTRVWDVTEERSCVVFKGHSTWVSATAWSPQPRNGAPIVASGSIDTVILVWNPVTREVFRDLRAHKNWVVSLCWRAVDVGGGVGGPAMKLSLLSASKDRSVLHWDVEAGTVLTAFDGHKDEVLCVKISGNGRHILTSSLDQTARIWNVETGTVVSQLRGHKGGVFSGAWGPRDARVVTGGGDNLVIVWDARTGAVTSDVVGHRTAVRCVAWSPLSDRFVTVSSDGHAIVWDVESGAVVFGIDDAASGGFTCCAWSPNGTYLAFGNTNATISVRTAQRGAAVFDVARNQGVIKAVEWGSDSSKFAVAMERYVTVWDFTTRCRIETFNGHLDTVTAMCWSFAGKFIATGSADKSVMLWADGSGRNTSAKDIPNGQGDLSHVSPASSNHNFLKESPFAKQRRYTGHTAEVTSVTCNPDGTRVASGSVDNTVLVFAADTLQTLFRLAAHSRPVHSVHWSHCGSRLISAGLDKVIRLFNAETGELVAFLEGHGDAVNNAKFDPHGKRVVSCSDDSRIFVWDAVEGNLFVLYDVKNRERVGDSVVVRRRVPRGRLTGSSVRATSQRSLLAGSLRGGGGTEEVAKISDMRPGELFAFLNSRHSKASGRPNPPRPTIAPTSIATRGSRQSKFTAAALQAGGGSFSVISGGKEP